MAFGFIVEHAVALCDGDTATEEHLPAYLLGEPHAKPPSAVELSSPRADLVDGHAGVDAPSADEARPPSPWAAPPKRMPTPADPVDLEHDLAEYEKAVLLRALDQAGGVKKRAAELLGINYRSLRHRLQKYGLGDAEDSSAMQ